MKKVNMVVAIDKAFAERLDNLAKALSAKHMGIPLDRSKVVRLCLERSLSDLEATVGLSTAGI